MLSEVGTTVLSSDKHLRNGNFSCRLTVAKLFLLEKEGKNAVFKAVFFFFSSLEVRSQDPSRSRITWELLEMQIFWPRPRPTQPVYEGWG